MKKNVDLLLLILEILLVAFFVALVVNVTYSKQPPAQLSLPCTIVEVYDGDTLTVEVSLKARVRLLDCWAPELRDAGGKASRDNLKQHEGKEAILQIPLEGADRLDDIFTFGRVLGYIYVGEVSLSDKQVREGFATKEKNR